MWYFLGGCKLKTFTKDSLIKELNALGLIVVPVGAMVSDKCKRMQQNTNSQTLLHIMLD